MSELTIQKRRSGTISGAERITGVKNAQAEMLLSRRINQYQNSYKRAQMKLQIEEYRLNHEARLLTLDNKLNDLEYKRRLYPNSDLSHEEMTVNNIKKYLVRNAENLCYLDKTTEHPIRNQSSADRIPSVVAKARQTIRRNELMKELEESKMRMYSFLHSNDHHNQTHANAFITDLDDEEDALDKALRNNQNVFPEVPTIVARPVTNRRQKTIKEKLQANPIIMRAYETHKQRIEEQNANQPSVTAEEVLARMARIKPPTKTDIMEEVVKVQDQVDEFNTNIEKVVWDFKQEEFQQGLKFVKDKDAELNKFMDRMNKRNRADHERPQTTPSLAFRKTLPTFEQRRPLTEGQKRKLLMQNLLQGVELKPIIQQPLTKKRGIPHHAAARLARKTASAKMESTAADAMVALPPSATQRL